MIDEYHVRVRTHAFYLQVNMKIKTSGKALNDDFFQCENIIVFGRLGQAVRFRMPMLFDAVMSVRHTSFL